MKFEAKLNRWVGGGFENNTRCALCHKPGSVALVPIPGRMLNRFKMCIRCLTAARAAIYGADLSACRSGRGGQMKLIIHDGNHGAVVTLTVSREEFDTPESREVLMEEVHERLLVQEAALHLSGFTGRIGE